MAADLEPVAVRPDMVGVVDHPAGEPQHLLLERGQTAALRIGRGFGRAGGKLEHGRIERPARPSRQRCAGVTLASACHEWETVSSRIMQPGKERCLRRSATI